MSEYKITINTYGFKCPNCGTDFILRYDTKEFLKIKPKEWQMYIETMYSMAAGVEKRYWKFLKDMVVEKKERKKKGIKIEQKTETKTEPAA